MRKLIIGVDFDGTLAVENLSNLLRPGAPVPGAIEALKKLKADGHTVVIWTCRDREWLDEAREWLDEHGVPYDACNEQMPGFDSSRKIYCDVYVDDRSVEFVNEDHVDWDVAYRLIRRFAERSDSAKPTAAEYGATSV